MKPLLICGLLASALPLGGCVASIASSAVGMAVRGAQGQPQDNSYLAPNAKDACSARAAPYGKVQIIDMQQVSIDKIKVWGTADDGTTRRSFECNFGTKVTGFKLRTIATSH
ncbi:hypothetical protein [Sphingomonas sp. PB4P5]|uniref:hypothetical protein n=1 Tax=Parasphingomonas puruogangriensis TaxID=3096155 RepID=UPI002FC6372C